MGAKRNETVRKIETSSKSNQGQAGTVQIEQNFPLIILKKQKGFSYRIFLRGAI